MKKTIKTEVMTFKFEELPSEKAKEQARQWFREAEASFFWSDIKEQIEEDTKMIGFELVSWETDAWNNGYKLEGRFMVSAVETSEAILRDHGKECGTYKSAQWFDDEMDKLPELPNENSPTYPECERRLCESVDALEGDFMARLEADYKRMVQAEAEYRTSDAYIDENIIANEYTFTADGKRFG